MSLKAAYSPETFRKNGHQLIDQLADYLTLAQNRSTPKAIAWRDPEEEFTYWDQRAASENPQKLYEAILKQSVNVQHPRYMGHQISPPLPITALAGLVSDFLNNGMGVYEMGVASTALEKKVIQTVIEVMNYGANADGFLTSGGTLANLTALLTARRAKTNTDVWTQGTTQQYAIMVSEEAHYCVDRAVRVMGWGDKGVIKIPSNHAHVIKKEILNEYYKKSKEENIEVLAVVGSACSTSTGSFDDLNAIADFCEANNLWFHVDGAHGGGTIFSKKYAPLVAGIERADSVILDFHKLLMTPAITTAILYKDGRHAFNTFAQKAQYLWENSAEPEWFNIAKRSFECTKTMMSIKIYSIIDTYGTAIFEEYIDQVFDTGRLLAALVKARPHFELAIEPQCNIVCFRYAPPHHSEEDLNILNNQIRQRMLEEGKFYIVKTNLRGKVYLRVTLSNPFTTKEDLNEMLDAL